jgi:hypothetical protein
MTFSGPMEDRLAIRELCDRYADAVMSKDRVKFGETFAEDAERERLGAVTKGRAAIVAETGKNMDLYSTGIFFCNIGGTQVNGDRATGRCYQVEILHLPGGPQWFFHYYDDVYVKIGGQWYFQKRSLTMIEKGKFPGSGP